MDNPTGGEPIVRENINLAWVKFVLALFVLLGVAGGAWWYAKLYYPGLMVVTPVEVHDGEEFGIVDPVDATTATALTEAYAQIIETAENEPFVTGLVPEAADRITLVAPAADSSGDAADYQNRVGQLSPNEKALAPFDGVNNLVFENGQTFTDVIDAHPAAASLYQMQDEIMYVAHDINARYARPALKDRIENVETLTTPMPDPFDQTTVLTYPSGRAVNAFMIATLMGKLDPTNAELYQSNATALAERGIAYGEYGLSDMEAARSLVEQYFALVDFEIESGLELTW
jgi:hypothetical protein